MATLAKILAAKASKPSSGIKITPESEKAALAAELEQTLANNSALPKPLPPAPRELGATVPGERIPMDHPPAEADNKDWVWFDCLHSPETDLCIVPDPDGLHAWLGVKYQPGKSPCLLLRLPLFSGPTQRPSEARLNGDGTDPGHQ